MHKYQSIYKFLNDHQINVNNQNRITKIINYIDGSNWLDTSVEESGHTNYMNQQNGIAILKEI